MLLNTNDKALNKSENIDYYLKHLSNFSESKAVKTHCDIISGCGAVLISCNTTLTPKIFEQLLPHRLAMPIEFSIQISQAINSGSLMSLYKKLILSNSDFDFLNRNLDISKILEEACGYLDQFPVLYQKLTVLQILYPDDFMQALLSGYISLCLSEKMGEKRTHNIHAFIAGLIHDFSMMSLDPSLLRDEVEYTPQQWREMQNHCMTGFEHLSVIEGFPEEISQAVLDHHEHADGSGYPFGKMAGNLSVTAQIVSMVDACIGIYQRESGLEKLGADALLPVIEMNADMYIPCVYTAALDILSAVPCEFKRVHDDQDMPTVISGLLLDNEEIQHDYCILYALITSIKPALITEDNTRIEKNDLNKIQDNIEPLVCRSAINNVLSMASRINKSLISSGLLQNEHSEWMVISCGAQQEYDYIAIEYLEVIYGEIRWQVKQLRHLVSLILSDHLIKEDVNAKQVKQGLLQIAQYHQTNKHVCIEH